jgi:dTDP-4-amino-4,6-dideoxygalactose transaminase
MRLLSAVHHHPPACQISSWRFGREMSLTVDQLGEKPRRMMHSATVSRPGPNIPVTGRLIPLPDVPVEPVLSLGAFVPAGAPTVPCVLDTGSVTPFVAGRYAIAWALKVMGVGKGDDVLMPAFHGMMMVEPLTSVSANPIFYKINEDLSVDLDDIQAKCSPSVRAIMATHYFGFPQNMAALRDFCDEANIFLIEDCAHSFFGRVDGRPVGAWGDYAVASPRKFFPIPEGGYLVDHSGKGTRIPLSAAGILSAAKSTLNFVEHSAYYGRLPVTGGLVNAAQSLRKRIIGGTAEVSESPADAETGQFEENASSEYEPALLDRKMALPSRLIRAMVSKERAIQGRRTNYQRLLNGLSDVPGCRPLFTHLSDDIVPHMFPLRVDDLDGAFPLLEDAAVPMQRFGQFLWSGVDETVCRVTNDLSHHLVQFPCHQSLTEAEIESILSRIHSCLARATRP